MTFVFGCSWVVGEGAHSSGSTTRQWMLIAACVGDERGQSLLPLLSSSAKQQERSNNRRATVQQHNNNNQLSDHFCPDPTVPLEEKGPHSEMPFPHVHIASKVNHTQQARSSHALTNTHTHMHTSSCSSALLFCFSTRSPLLCDSFGKAKRLFFALFLGEAPRRASVCMA